MDKAAGIEKDSQLLMNNLFYNSVSNTLVDILRLCMSAECLRGFILVGGTALALQRGHRVSLDIDLFTDMDYGTMPMTEIKAFFQSNFKKVDGLENLNESALCYQLHVQSDNGLWVKVDLCYTERFIFPTLFMDGIRLADEKEIAAMKILAIAGLSYRLKDYWDIYELYKDYTLATMIRWGLKRNPYAIDLNDLKSAFQNVMNMPGDNREVCSLLYENWELIRLDLAEAYREEEMEIGLIKPDLE